MTKFKTILIPLDGSKLAEAALPAATSIAKHADPVGELVLLRIVPDIWIDDVMLPEQLEEFQTRVTHSCQEYLDTIAERLRHEGLTVTALVASGEPAKQILDGAARSGANVIAMATHGRSGWERATMGSVADKVLQHASIPVLLVRPPETVTGRY